MDKEELKRSIRNQLTWRNYFNPREVEDALVLGNNPELLRKVRACQAILDAEYDSKASVLSRGLEKECEEVCNTFMKPTIDIEKI